MTGPAVPPDVERRLRSLQDELDRLADTNRRLADTLREARNQIVTLKEEVDRPLDHRNLNEEIPEFRDVVPTAENLARWIWDRVDARLVRDGRPCRVARLTLTVTPTFRVELTR